MIHSRKGGQLLIKGCWCALLAGPASAQSITPPDPLAFVAGRVLMAGSGEPIRKARVTLDSTKSDDKTELVAVTDEMGRFRFADLKAGPYSLQSGKDGYLPGSFGQVQPSDPTSLLKVSAGEHVSDVVLRLFPAASISGQVLDAEGDPAPGRQVFLWAKRNNRKRTPFERSQDTTTDHDGRYRFAGLMPGTYYVGVEPSDSNEEPAKKQVFVDSDGKPTNLHDYRTFFQAVPSLALAQSIRVAGGQEQAGTDIRVQRGPLFSVSGKIAGALGRMVGISVDAFQDREAMIAGSHSGRVESDGSFVLEGLAPGKLRLLLRRHGPSGIQTVGSTEVEMTDQNISGLVITQLEPATVRVRVMMEGEAAPLTVGSVYLNPADTDTSSAFTNYQFVPDQGAYVMNDVVPGKYLFGFTNVSHCFLKTVTSGDREISRDAVDVTSGAHLDLVLTYSRNVASLGGDVEVPPDRPKKPIYILMTAEDDPALNGVWSVEADQFLHFSVDDRAPGKYVLFAAEEGDLDLWNDDDFRRLMLSAGTPIDLHEKEHATLHLKLIPTEVSDQVKKQLGL